MYIDVAKTLIQYCVERGIRFNFALQFPGNFDYLDEASVNAVAEKVTKIAREGAADISLLMNELVQLSGTMGITPITNIYFQSLKLKNTET